MTDNYMSPNCSFTWEVLTASSHDDNRSLKEHNLWGTLSTEHAVQRSIVGNAFGYRMPTNYG